MGQKFKKKKMKTLCIAFIFKKLNIRIKGGEAIT